MTILDLFSTFWQISGQIPVWNFQSILRERAPKNRKNDKNRKKVEKSSIFSRQNQHELQKFQNIDFFFVRKGLVPILGHEKHQKWPKWQNFGQK